MLYSFSRQVGIKNGMFFGQAKQLCPNLQAVPYDFHAYKEVARTMYETLARYSIFHSYFHVCAFLLISNNEDSPAFFRTGRVIFARLLPLLVSLSSAIPVISSQS